jgi:hypothetical protein
MPREATVKINAEPVAKPTLVLPPADVLSLKPIQWRVITEGNAAETLGNSMSTGAPVLFAITAEDYAKLSQNISSIRLYIQQQQAVIAGYKQYYQQADQSIDSANNKIITLIKQWRGEQQ